MKVQSFVEHFFKDSLNEHTLKQYIKIAKFCDVYDEEAYLWDGKEAYDNYNIYLYSEDCKDLEDGLNIPSKETFKEFGKNKAISNLFLKMVIQDQAVEVRRVIKNIATTKTINQGDMKALNLLIDLVEEVGQDDQTYYVQYTVPIRFDGSDSEKIINDLLVKEEKTNE